MKIRRKASKRKKKGKSAVVLNQSRQKKRSSR